MDSVTELPPVLLPDLADLGEEMTLSIKSSLERGMRSTRGVGTPGYRLSTLSRLVAGFDCRTSSLEAAFGSVMCVSLVVALIPSSELAVLPRVVSTLQSAFLFASHGRRLRPLALFGLANVLDRLDVAFELVVTADGRLSLCAAPGERSLFLVGVAGVIGDSRCRKLIRCAVCAM